MTDTDWVHTAMRNMGMMDLLHGWRRRQIVTLGLLSAILVFVAIVPNAESSQNNKEKPVVLEILTWKAKSPDVSDDEMIAAVAGLVPDLKMLKGFQSQSLYKDSDGTWVDVYYWDSEEDAHASNDAMADKVSLARLIVLIAPGSITIEVMTAVQSSE